MIGFIRHKIRWSVGCMLAFFAIAFVVDSVGFAQSSPGRVKDDASNATRFSWVDVYVDSGNNELGAYQLEVSAATGEVAIVGIEGGDHTVFATPPYYDTKAIQQDRVIIAAYSTDESLPVGQTRVARIHVMITGDTNPTYEIELTTAVTADGSDIEADAFVAEGE